MVDGPDVSAGFVTRGKSRNPPPPPSDGMYVTTLITYTLNTYIYIPSYKQQLSNDEDHKI